MDYWPLFIILAGLLSFIVRWRLTDPSGKRHPFPDRHQVKICFDEPRVDVIIPNGKIEIFGSSKVFHVIVTPDEVWITAPRTFGFLSRALNANHRIRINSITEIVTKWRWTTIWYQHEDSTNRKVELKLRDLQGFMDALDHAGFGSHPA
tara:strand:- start:40 stop:486 length:447 start_codon:yes stop_codon:yes gene_type:complete